MKLETIGHEALDYAQCSYGLSRLPVRGPRQALDTDFVAVVGGTEVFGKFVAQPLDARLEARLGKACVNFGTVNAGIDALWQDGAMTATLQDARAVVLQVTGAQNLSNRFYRVHPRRNDRFLGPTALLREVYGEVDFSDFAFTGHMLSTLLKVCPRRFALVRRECRKVWAERMREVIAEIGRPVVLLQFGETPIFVTDAMVDDLAGEVAGVVRCAGADGTTEGMIVAPGQETAARALPGPAAHDGAAEALDPVLRALI